MLNLCPYLRTLFRSGKDRESKLDRVLGNTSSVDRELQRDLDAALLKHRRKCEAAAAVEQADAEEVQDLKSAKEESTVKRKRARTVDLKKLFEDEAPDPSVEDED